MNYNFKTKTLRLVQAGILASVFAASSAQAIFVTQQIYCEDGWSYVNAVQFSYVYQPTTITTYLSGGSAPMVVKQKTTAVGSWYTPFRAHRLSTPQHDSEFRSIMTMHSGPGFFNYKFVPALQIKDIALSGTTTDQSFFGIFTSSKCVYKQFYI